MKRLMKLKAKRPWRISSFSFQHRWSSKVEDDVLVDQSAHLIHFIILSGPLTLIKPFYMLNVLITPFTLHFWLFTLGTPELIFHYIFQV